MSASPSTDDPPDAFNLARYCLAASARLHPAKPALILADDPVRPKTARVWAYAEIEDLVLRLSAGFRSLELGAGERVFIRMGNSLDYALAYLAANAAGLVPVPASPLLAPPEVEFLVADCGARLVLSDGRLPIPPLPAGVRLLGPREFEALKATSRGDYASTHASDPAYLVYTSGTSGRPKGVLHAQRAVWGRRPMYRGWYDIHADDVVLHTGSLNWTYTLGSGLLDPWANGATALLYAGPRDITVWRRLVAANNATIMASVPGIYRQMLKYDAVRQGDMPSLRHALSAGEALSPALFEAWRERTGTTLYEAFGMSEISTYISASPSLTPPRPGSPGRPQPGRRVAIIPLDEGIEPLPAGETGLIAVDRSDPGLMLGYWMRPLEEADCFRGPWFVGGDLGRMDADGYVWFEGRRDDLMNAMGYRVGPEEVEAALASHPAVSEVGVAEVAVSDDIRVVMAFVVPVEGARCDADDLLRHAAGRLASYKLPREIRLVASLPRTSNGKLMRTELKALASGEAR